MIWPASCEEAPDSGRLILRDGSVATIRAANPGDGTDLQKFFLQLSPESRMHRFLSLTAPEPAVIDSLCRASNPEEQLTLLVKRYHGSR